MRSSITQAKPTPCQLRLFPLILLPADILRQTDVSAYPAERASGSALSFPGTPDIGFKQPVISKPPLVISARFQRFHHHLHMRIRIISKIQRHRLSH